MDVVKPSGTLRHRWLLCAALVLTLVAPLASQRSTIATTAGFEVWAVDQSGTAGTLYIYQGDALNDDAATAVPEVIDLGEAVRSVCVEQTGSAPVRGHMLTFNPSHTHAILSYVATGHVVFMDAVTRAPLACIDVGIQAHAAFAFPDASKVIVANQNGKLLQRITTDYATNTFTLDVAATLDLATCVTPSGAACQDPVLRPDNAPICPIIDSTNRLVFTTLRGGGMFVVDGTTTPMRILAEYDRSVVQPEGCGGVEQAGSLYVNSGNANPAASHLYAFSLDAFAGAGPYPANTPAPTLIFAQTGGDFNTHGLALLPAKQGRYLWAADRFANTVEVVDTTTDTLVNRFRLVESAQRRPRTGPHGGCAWRSVCLRVPAWSLPPHRQLHRHQQCGWIHAGRWGDRDPARRVQWKTGCRGTDHPDGHAIHVLLGWRRPHVDGARRCPCHCRADHVSGRWTVQDPCSTRDAEDSTGVGSGQPQCCIVSKESHYQRLSG